MKKRSKNKIKTRMVELVVLPRKHQLYGEEATRVSIEDEGGGEFVCVEQTPQAGDTNTVRINPEEWPAMRSAIDRLIASCRMPKPESLKRA